MGVVQNRTRFDLSPWLIHFTRAIDLQAGDAPDAFPIEWPFGDIVEQDLISPFFLLRRIIRTRQIRSSFSRRGGKATIYGPHSAVCFTEMPLAAFVETSRTRSEAGEKISSYAVLLPREQAHAVGARPVIYGLSQPAHEVRGPVGTRDLATSQLPLHEQYRYATFAPKPDGGVDWTHEREWRWCNPSAPGFVEYEAPEGREEEHGRWIDARMSDRHDADGLCLDAEDFRGLGVMVRTPRQVELVVREILRFVDADRIRSDLFSFVIEGDKLTSSSAIIDPAAVASLVSGAKIDMGPLLAVDAASDKQWVASFDKLVDALVQTHPEAPGEPGQCWLWLTDNKHPLTRALLHHDRIVVSKAGRYLVELPELSGRGLASRERLVDSLAKEIIDNVGTLALRFSVLGSGNPDATPFYVNDVNAVLDNEIYKNYAHNEDDF